MSDIVHKNKLCEITETLFRHWLLTLQQSLDVLRIPDLIELNQWCSSSVNNAKLSHRIEKILQIHACLRLLFPGDVDLAYSWIKNKNRAFGKSPLKHIIENRESGLEEVATYLQNQCFSLVKPT